MTFDNTKTALHRHAVYIIEKNIQPFFQDEYEQYEDDGRNVFGTKAIWRELTLEYIDHTIADYEKYLRTHNYGFELHDSTEFIELLTFMKTVNQEISLNNIENITYLYTKYVFRTYYDLNWITNQITIFEKKSDEEISITELFENNFMGFLSTYKYISDLNSVKTDYFNYLYFQNRFIIKPPNTGTEYISIIQTLRSERILNNKSYYDKISQIQYLYSAYLAEEEYGDLEWIDEQVRIHALNKIKEHHITNNWLLHKIYIPRMRLFVQDIYK